MSDRLNQVIYVGAVFGILGFATASKLNSKAPLVLAGILWLVVTNKSLYTILQIIRHREGFRNSGNSDRPDMPDSPSPNVDVIGPKNQGIESAPVKFKGHNVKEKTETVPTPRNPFMNVLVDELKYNPTRPAAASVLDPAVRVTLDEFFKTEFYSDPTDVFGKTQGQRQFITMPSTSIPNDVDSYQNWLYKIPGKTCKEGGREACLPGTDGGALPWLNQGATPVLDDHEVNRNPVAYNGIGSGTDNGAVGSPV